MRDNGQATLLKCPPAYPLDYWPEDIYSIDEMTMLKDWLKATLRCKGPEEFEKASKPWSDERRAEVARMLSELRGRGFYPDRINEDGRIAWGVLLKSQIDVDMHLHGGKYEEKGKMIAENGGSFFDGYLPPMGTANGSLASTSR